MNPEDHHETSNVANAGDNPPLAMVDLVMVLVFQILSLSWLLPMLELLFQVRLLPSIWLLPLLWMPLSFQIFLPFQIPFFWMLTMCPLKFQMSTLFQSPQMFQLLLLFPHKFQLFPLFPPMFRLLPLLFPMFWLFVKIFIAAVISNAMNPRENLTVPSLCRTAVPGLYARSHSASLGLLQSGQT